MDRDNGVKYAFCLDCVFDLVLNLASLMIAYKFALYANSLTHAAAPELDISSLKTWIAIFTMPPLISVFLMIFGAYDKIPLISPYSVLVRVLLSDLFAYLFVLIIDTVLFYEHREFVILWMSLCMLISFAVLSIKRAVYVAVLSFSRARGNIVRRIIAIGDDAESIRRLRDAVNSDTRGAVMLLGYIGECGMMSDADRLGGYSECKRIIEKLRPTDAVLAFKETDENIKEFASLCSQNMVKVLLLPSYYGQITSGCAADISSLAMTDMYALGEGSALYDTVKRAADIAISSVLILATSPVMLFTALAVKLTSRGPVIFKQKRIGKNGVPFVILKFRTMRINSESDTGWTRSADERKTRIGSFLRKYAIDELPQLFNVLFGSMSLVGPRPETPYHAERLGRIVDGYMLRHTVKPGMTGLAQISGLRGDTSIEERTRIDLEYIRRRSLRFDTEILLRTPFALVNRAEGKTHKEKDNRQKTRNESTFDGSRRVLYTASTVGHIESFHMPYIEALRKMGYTVATMARGDRADFDIPFEKKILSASNTASRELVRRAVSSFAPDVIILNTSLAAFHVRLALHSFKRPRVVNISHGYLFSRGDGFLKYLFFLAAEKITANKTDEILVMNREDEKAALGHKLCRGRVRFIRGMGVRERRGSKTRNDIRRELGCSDRFVLLFVGELCGRKNQEFLVLSLAFIQEYIPSAVLLLVGGGDDMHRITELALKLGLGESVILTGYTDNVGDYLSCADLYVSASLSEGMPFNIIEAMGAGLTVAASDIKGHRDIIDDGVNGFLFNKDDMNSFISIAVDIRNGKRHIDKDAIYKTYEKYSFNKVFDETLMSIKEALADDDKD